MDSLSGSGRNPNPTNNPRLDLLHNTGNNQQLAGAAGSYGPAPLPVTPPPVPRPHPQPSVAASVARPQTASSYVAAAEAKRPAAPVPLPTPAPPPPRPAPEPSHPTPTPPRSRRPLVLGVIAVILLAAIGGGVWWWVSHHTTTSQPPAAPQVAVTPVTPTNLSQADSSGNSVDVGGTTKAAKLTFAFNVSTNATTGSLTPEVELEPIGTAFTGTPTLTGQAVGASGGNMQFSVTTSTLTNGAYHWQARVSTGGQHSGWALFGGSATTTAFTVDVAAATTPNVTSVGGAAVANPTVVTSNQPPIVGTADPNSTITVSVSPDSQQFTTTSDANGAWSLTPSTAIPNGQHQLSITETNAAGTVSSPLSIALTINPATAADTTPSSTATTPPASSTSAASSSSAASTPSTHLAETGDNTTAVSLASLLVMLLAAIGLVVMRRRHAGL